MSEGMLPVSAVDWSQVMASPEKPVEFLLRKDVAVYIKVRRDSEIVYRYYKAPIKAGERGNSVPYAAFLRAEALLLEGEALADFVRSRACGEEEIDSLPYAGFVEEAAFLRLGDAALAEIAVSRSCHVSSFSGAGFLIPRPYEVTGQTRGGYSVRKPLRIEAAELTKFEFDRAFIVDKKKRDSVLARMSPMNEPSPKQFAIQVEVGESDLYVTSADVEALKQDASKDYEVLDYPFDHGKRMPGVYWMFQAAVALNDKHLIGEDAVLEWLGARCAGEVFGGKRGGFAAKLIPKELDRAKGRKGGPRPFKVWDLKNWVENPDRFIFEFASEGLTTILAVADWWLELLERSPDESRVTLAKKLYEQNFDQTETGYVVHLLTGVQLSKLEKKFFGEWVSEKSRREVVR